MATTPPQPPLTPGPPEARPAYSLRDFGYAGTHLPAPAALPGPASAPAPAPPARMAAPPPPPPRQAAAPPPPPPRQAAAPPSPPPRQAAVPPPPPPRQAAAPRFPPHHPALAFGYQGTHIQVLPAGVLPFAGPQPGSAPTPPAGVAAPPAPASTSPPPVRILARQPPAPALEWGRAQWGAASPPPPQPPPPNGVLPTPAAPSARAGPKRQAFLGRPAGPPPPPPTVAPSALPEVDYAAVGAFVAALHAEQAEATMAVLPAWHALHAQLQDLLQSKYGDHARLHVFGSFVQNIPRRSSDLDLCLILNSNEKPALKRDQQVKLVEGLWVFLRQTLANKGEAVLRARVPIVAFDHFDISFRFDGCINSHWVRGYVDENRLLIQPLCTTLLCWIEAEDLKDNRNGYFSSYTITLLLLYYLLYDGHIAWRKPARDPAQMAPKQFAPFPETAFARAEDIDRALVGRCLVGFFEFYLRRFPRSLVVQFRKPPAEWPLTQESKWWQHCLAVEDPFETEFNPARNIVKDTWAFIKDRMEAAYTHLTTNPATPLFALRPAPHCTPALVLAPPAAAPPDEEAAPPDEEAALRAMTAALLAAGPVEAVALGEACLRQNAELYRAVVGQQYDGFLTRFLRAHPDQFRVAFPHLIVSLVPPNAPLPPSPETIVPPLDSAPSDSEPAWA